MGSNSREFRAAVRTAGKRITEEQLPAVVVRIGFDALGRIVRKTPVDTGRLRGSIQADLNRQPSGEGQSDKGGARAQLIGQNAIARYRLGDTVFIGTNVEYAPFIERGRRMDENGVARGSLQAPKGMFGVTTAELRRAYRGILR